MPQEQINYYICISSTTPCG